MTEIEPRPSERPEGAADLLALGFGTAVAMWAVGYVGRLPVVVAPAWLIGITLVAVPVAGGFVAGRRTARGWTGGLWTGMLAGLLDLLVLGSFLSGDRPNGLRPAALIFVPAFVVVMGLLGSIGAALGARGRASSRREPEWTAAFAKVALAATLLLLVAGGVVTSSNSGLAVVDWPNSFGYNMFLYPISRMTGGIFYEHAHRLLGSLVGLTTLVLAAHLVRVDRRAWLRGLAVAAFVLVCVQGLLGGLRVTGTLTLSDDPSVTTPDIRLAVLHGILGQVFFSVLAVVAAASSRTWKHDRPARQDVAAATDRGLGLVVVVLLLVQLTVGALQRHLAAGLMIHLVLAFAVAGCALASGLRLWGRLGRDEPVLGRVGLALMAVTGAQLALGLGAYVVTSATASGSRWDVVVTTAHQGMGAVLLATAVASAAWTRRFVAAPSLLPEGARRAV